MHERRTRSSTEPVVELRDVSKAFGGTRALVGVSLTLRAGEVHGLVGPNGSGKSTLVKILSGYHAPDSGELALRGVPVRLPLLPNEPRSLGLAFVHQDLGLIDSLSVLENLRVGRYRTGRLSRISWRRERRLAIEMLGRFGISIDPDSTVSRLRQVDRAVVAIVRALQDLEGWSGRLLVLDEPTAYLPRDSLNRLFEVVRNVADHQNAVLFVSHQLGEIMDLTDRVTVIRDARVVGSLPTTDIAESELIRMILGRDLEELYPDRLEPRREGALLSATSVSGRVVRDLSLELHPGEIVGVTGIAGMGFEEVPYLLTGAERPLSGTIAFAGSSIPASELAPPRALAAGVALVPGDRGRQGLAPPLSVEDNLALPILRRHFTGFVLRHGEIRAAVERQIADFNVRPPDPRRPMWTLSGGNQQKAILGKWYQTEPKILLLHEPTAGVDIGARKQIFELISQAAANGTAVLIASQEYEDLAHMCDRVLIFRDGRVVRQLPRADLTEERLIEQCYRVPDSRDGHLHAAGFDGKWERRGRAER